MGSSAPRAVDRGDRQATGTGGPARREYASAVVGLGMLVVGLLALAPALAEVAHPLRYLAATALVGLLVVGWLAVWTCLEAVWRWRAGRPDGS